MANEMQLKKMNRMEQLIDLLLKLMEENEELKAENAELSSQLDERRIVIDEAGSIAQAALQLNGIFEAAQKAADDYLDSVADTDDTARRIVDDAHAQAETIIRDAQSKSLKLIEQTQIACQWLLKQVGIIYDKKKST